MESNKITLKLDDNAIEKFKVNKNEEGKVVLTDDQVKEIAEVAESVKEESEDLKSVAELPSNNGTEEHEPEEGYEKKVKVMIDPTTGERAVLGDADEDDADYDESFEDLISKIDASDIKFETVDKPLTLEDFRKFVDDDKNNSLFAEIAKETKFSGNDIMTLIEVANRVKNKEDFGVYQALPDAIKKMIQDYCAKGGINLNDNQGRMFRNAIAENIISDFIVNVSMDRVQHDFSKELEDLFNKSAEQLSEDIVGYTNDRLKAYRDYAERMEDASQKEKLLAILDSIQEAYDLTSFKEYASHCKIKKYDFEKPERIYDTFTRKYKDSQFNIYGIDVAKPIVLRYLNRYRDGRELEAPLYDERDVDAFFIAFCKYTLNYEPEKDIKEHAFMYYVIYNCVLCEINKGKEKDVSWKFLENVADVIKNLRERNNLFIYS